MKKEKREAEKKLEEMVMSVKKDATHEEVEDIVSFSYFENVCTSSHPYLKSWINPPLGGNFTSYRKSHHIFIQNRYSMVFQWNGSLMDV